MDKNAQRFCAWSGLVFMLFFLTGWVIFAAEFFPPHPPSASAADIVARYRSSPNLLRFGLILLIFGAGFFALFSAALGNYLLRLTSPRAPILALAQLIGGAVNTIFFILSPVLWGVAAYRLERNPDVVQALNDLGWFLFFQPASLILVQFLTLAYAILCDKSAHPVLPRWVGFVNVWIAAIFLPSYMLTFFKSGAFAWNGIFIFWVPVAAFAPWVVIHVHYLLKAARHATTHDDHRCASGG